MVIFHSYVSHYQRVTFCGKSNAISSRTIRFWGWLESRDDSWLTKMLNAAFCAAASRWASPSSLQSRCNSWGQHISSMYERLIAWCSDICMYVYIYIYIYLYSIYYRNWEFPIQLIDSDRYWRSCVIYVHTRADYNRTFNHIWHIANICSHVGIAMS